MTTLHVLTGATGFVGSAILLELLTRDERARVVGIVRPGGRDPTQRLHEILHAAARLYGHGAALDVAIAERCEAVAGDLHEPRCGVPTLQGFRGAELWHCAASLQFQDRHEAEIMRTNVEGTAHAIELARALEVRCINAVSTAYVAGLRRDSIAETPAEPGAANNHYERSKVAAEALLRESGLPLRVLRPSIVIGHSHTRAALNFNGLYGFMRALFKFRGLMERTQTHLMDTLELRLIVDADATVDLVPIDLVARDAVALSREDAPLGIYHLNLAEPPSARLVVATIFDVLGLRPPVFVESRDAFEWLDRKLDERLDFYAAYLRGNKRFDRSRSAAIAGSSGGRFDMSATAIRAFCTWYLEHELLARQPLPESA